MLCVGGGTAGSVSPLLAMVEAVQKRTPDVAVRFLGGHRGPEQRMAEEAGIPFAAITATKLRRYLSWRTLLVPVELIIAFFESLRELRAWRPDVVVSAGSYVAVPVLWAAGVMGIPILLHQQDIRKGLANALTAPFARRITVSFEESLGDFPKDKTVCIGNPVRAALATADITAARKYFSLSGEKKVILILGGSSGAVGLNRLLIHAAPELLEHAEIIHVTGAGKAEKFSHPRYHPVEFLGVREMGYAYAVADLAVCRAGLSTLSELAAFARAAIFVPLPGTHQEENAAFGQSHHAAMVVQEKEGSALLAARILALLENDAQRTAFAAAMGKLNKPDASVRAAEIIKEIAHG